MLLKEAQQENRNTMTIKNLQHNFIHLQEVIKLPIDFP